MFYCRKNVSILVFYWSFTEWKIDYLIVMSYSVKDRFYGKCSISHCDAALVLFYLSNLLQVECPPVLDSDKRSIVISLGLSSKGIPAQFYFRDSFYVYCLPIFLCLIIYLSNVMLLLQIKYWNFIH